MCRIVTERPGRGPAVQPGPPVVKEEVTATLTLTVLESWSVGLTTARRQSQGFPPLVTAATSSTPAGG